MCKNFKNLIAKLLIISIFFNLIFDVGSLKIVRAEILNSIVEENNVESKEEDSIRDEELINNEDVNTIDEEDEINQSIEESLEDSLEENFNDTDKVIDEESYNSDSESVEENKITETRNESVFQSSTTKPTISYQAHVQDIGWQDWIKEGGLAGTTGMAKPIEALNINVEGLPEGAKLKYRSHVRDIGWQDWKVNGELTGTTGRALSIESIEISLEGNELSYGIMYRVHIRDIGWQDWKKNGELAGTTGMAKPIEAIEIKLVAKDEANEDESEKIEISEIKYQTHVSEEGWTSWSGSTSISGSTSNNKIEAFSIKLTNGNNSIIKYRAYIKNKGWQEWKSSGEVSGTEGQNLAIEKIEIALDNAPAGYSIEYRIKTSANGLSEWKKDGQTISGNGSNIIGLQIRLKDMNSIPSISYQAHVREIGWQDYVSDGQMAGTTGKALSIEAMKINYKIGDKNANISYKTHVQDIGWQNWFSNDEIAGTTGKAKPIEAIQIKQENKVEGYKLKYRVHVRDLGWQGWKSEGEIAGTTGIAKPIEAIEIKFVDEEDEEENMKTIVIDPGHNFGGDDGAYATHGGVTYIERDINMQIAMKLKESLENSGFKVILTRNPEDRETLAVRQSLEKRVQLANNSDAELFISIHQNSSISSVKGVEVYYSSVKPISGTAHTQKVSKSKALATSVSESLSKTISTYNRGAKDDDFYVVKNTLMPSILIECGFISNSEEARKLANSSYQSKIADTISKEVTKLFN